MADQKPPTEIKEKPIDNPRASPSKNAKKGPDRPWDEILREDSGRLLRKLALKPEALIHAGVAPTFMRDLGTLMLYKSPPGEKQP